jgi:hypothetical protein
MPDSQVVVESSSVMRREVLDVPTIPTYRVIGNINISPYLDRKDHNTVQATNARLTKYSYPSDQTPSQKPATTRSPSSHTPSPVPLSRRWVRRRIRFPGVVLRVRVLVRRSLGA